jgi:transcriptional regulator with XRE-family HTH domain
VAKARQDDMTDSVRALIQKLYTERGWTQTQLAQASGVATTTIYSIFDKKRANYRIQRKTLVKIALGLGIDPHVLLLADANDSTLADLLDAWCRLDDAGQASLVTLAQAMTAVGA